SAFPPPFSNVLIVANSFQSSLNSHILERFSVPALIGVDSAGTLKVDSVPKLLSGVLVVHFDTTGTSSPGSAKLRLYRIAQPWDTAGVSWLVRQTTGTL